MRCTGASTAVRARCRPSSPPSSTRHRRSALVTLSIEAGRGSHHRCRAPSRPGATRAPPSDRSGRPVGGGGSRAPAPGAARRSAGRPRGPDRCARAPPSTGRTSRAAVRTMPFRPRGSRARRAAVRARAARAHPGAQRRARRSRTAASRSSRCRRRGRRAARRNCERGATDEPRGEPPGPRSTAVATDTVLVVPLGSTEQHGPHLPLSTDTDIAVALAAAARGGPRRRRRSRRPFRTGRRGEHAAFPGTLSIGQAALELVVVELARSADAFAAVVHRVRPRRQRRAARPSRARHCEPKGRRVLGVVAAAVTSTRTPAGPRRRCSSRSNPSRVRLDAGAPGATQPLPELDRPAAVGRRARRSRPTACSATRRARRPTRAARCSTR